MYARRKKAYRLSTSNVWALQWTMLSPVVVWGLHLSRHCRTGCSNSAATCPCACSRYSQGRRRSLAYGPPGRIRRLPQHKTRSLYAPGDGHGDIGHAGLLRHIDKQKSTVRADGLCPDLLQRRLPPRIRHTVEDVLAACRVVVPDL